MEGRRVGRTPVAIPTEGDDAIAGAIRLLALLAYPAINDDIKRDRFVLAETNNALRKMGLETEGGPQSHSRYIDRQSKMATQRIERRYQAQEIAHELIRRRCRSVISSAGLPIGCFICQWLAGFGFNRGKHAL